MPYLNKDIYSRFNKGYCYGKAGDEVELVSDKDTILIVRHKGLKSGFPIDKEELSERKTEAISDDNSSINKSKTVGKSSKVKRAADLQTGQQLIFS